MHTAVLASPVFKAYRKHIYMSALHLDPSQTNP